MRPMQLRLARTALEMGVRELAEATGITANTISRIENGADAKQSTIDKLRQVLESRGIVFHEGHGTFGVSYRTDEVLDNGDTKFREIAYTIPKDAQK